MKNIETEAVAGCLLNPDSVYNKSVLTYQTRQELRIYRNKVLEVNKVYMELRGEMLQSYVQSGKAVEKDGMISFSADCIEEVNKKLSELGSVENDIKPLSKRAVSEIIKLNMTMAEEDILDIISGGLPETGSEKEADAGTE